MQTGMSRLKESFTPLREEDWEGVREALKARRWGHQKTCEDDTEPGSNRRAEPGHFPEENAELFV